MTPWLVIPPLIGIALIFWWYHSACLRRLQRTWCYGWLMHYPVACLRFSLCHTSMTNDKCLAGLKVLRKGHIIGTRDGWSLSAWLVPGYWTHILLCIGEIDGVMMCAEMTRDDYGEVHPLKAWIRSSKFVISECTEFDPDYIDYMVDNCRDFKGTKYDSLFVLGPKAVYCSEMPALCDTENRMGVTPSWEPLTGQWVITPGDLLGGANVVEVYNSDEEQA